MYVKFFSPVLLGAAMLGQVAVAHWTDQYSEAELQELAQNWALPESAQNDKDLAQIWHETRDPVILDQQNQLAQTYNYSESASESGSEAYSGSESGSEAYSGSGSESGAYSGSESGGRSEAKSESDSKSESESDSDSEFSNLQLAQQMQELNYYNAVGTINNAQVQAMQQQMAQMGALGMAQMGSMAGAMPAMGGMPQPGVSFAQTNTEDVVSSGGQVEPTQHELFLAQIAMVLAYMPEQEAETLDSYLAQLQADEIGGSEKVFAQVSSTGEHDLARLANMLAQLNEEDLAQVADLLSDDQEEFAQTSTAKSE